MLRRGAVLASVGLAVLLISGCASMPAKYVWDTTLNQLAPTPTTSSLASVLPKGVRRHVVGTATTKDGTKIAIAIANGVCGLAIDTPDGSLMAMSASAPTHGGTGVATPRWPGAADYVGPAQSASATEGHEDVLLACGTHGAYVSVATNAPLAKWAGEVAFAYPTPSPTHVGLFVSTEMG